MSQQGDRGGQNAPGGRREQVIVEVLLDAFAQLMEHDPVGFRTKFRKMAADPFAFYRGSACLFYADLARLDDPWADERTGRVWVHGDLHPENYGTYMNSTGRLVFDVNDFDEAYVGPFSWDLRRFAAGLALLGWQKALPEGTVRHLLEAYLHAYVDQVRHYVDSPDDDDFALRLDTAEGPVHEALQAARMSTRLDLLESLTTVEGHRRRFRDGSGVRRLDDGERSKVLRAFDAYLDTIPSSKRRRRDVFYDVKDVVAKHGSGVGSAGLPAYQVLIEGYNQALENDIVLSMKRGNLAAPSRVVTDQRIRDYFEHDGHRTAVSQRALQAHSDPFLGYTLLDGVGFVVDELSPYETGLAWADLTEPDQLVPVMTDLGRATAKVHCTSDEDSEQDLVRFQTEEAITEVVEDRVAELVDDIVGFGIEYAGRVRDDHAVFVDAFREDRIPGIEST